MTRGIYKKVELSKSYETQYLNGLERYRKPRLLVAVLFFCKKSGPDQQVEAKVPVVNASYGFASKTVVFEWYKKDKIQNDLMYGQGKQGYFKQSVLSGLVLFVEDISAK